jgi:hypothetical protein
LWIYRHTPFSKPAFSLTEYPFAVNKIRTFAHDALVRNDSDKEREEGSIMAKAMKKKVVAKKKTKKLVSKKRPAKRAAKRRR